MTMIEKRRYRRHVVTRFAWYQSIEPAGEAGVEGVSHILDISKGGLGLKCQRPMTPGTLLFVKVIFETPNHNLSAMGRIKYCLDAGDGTFSVGLEFVAVPPDSRDFLASHFG